MPYFTVFDEAKNKNRVYEIPENQISAFKNQYPTASKSFKYKVEDREYIIPGDDDERFLMQYPDAKLIQPEPEYPDAFTEQFDYEVPDYESQYDKQKSGMFASESTGVQQGEPVAEYDFSEEALAERAKNAPDTLQPIKSQFQGTGNKWVDNILSATLNLSAGLWKTPSLVFDSFYDLAAVPQNQLAAALDKPSWATSGEQFRQQGGRFNPLSMETFDEIAEIQREVANRYQDTAFDEYGGKGLIELAKTDPAAAGEYFLMQVASQAPQIAEVIWITAATKNPNLAMGLLSSQAAGMKRMELEETSPDMPDVTKNVNALTTGLIEFATEKSIGIGRVLDSMLKNDAFRAGFTNSMKRIIKDAARGFPAEGTEEIVAGISGDVLDTITGANEYSFQDIPRLLVENADQYIEQGLVGGAAGSLMAGGTSLAETRRLGAGFAQSNQNKEELSKLVAEASGFGSQGAPDMGLEQLAIIENEQEVLRTKLSEQHFRELMNYVQSTKEHLQRQVERQQTEAEQRIQMQLSQAEQLINERDFSTSATLVNELNQTIREAVNNNELDEDQIDFIREQRDIVTTLFEERLNAHQAEQRLFEEEEAAAEVQEDVAEEEIAAEAESERRLAVERQDVKGKLYDIYQEPDGTYTLEPRGKGMQQQWSQSQFEEFERRKAAGRKAWKKRAMGALKINEEQVQSAPALRMIPQIVADMPQGELSRFEGVMVRNNELVPKDPDKYGDQIKADQMVFDEMPRDFQERYPHLRGNDGNVDAGLLIEEALKELQWLQSNQGKTLPTVEERDEQLYDEMERAYAEEYDAEEYDEGTAQNVFDFFDEKAQSEQQQRTEELLRIWDEETTGEQESAGTDEDTDGVTGEDRGAAQPQDQPEQADSPAGEQADTGEAAGESDAGAVEAESGGIGSRDQVVGLAEMTEDLRAQARQLERELQQAERDENADRVEDLRNELTDVQAEIDMLESQGGYAADAVDINEDLSDVYYSDIYQDSPHETREDLTEEIQELREQLRQLDFSEKAQALEDKLAILEELARETQDGYNPDAPIFDKPITKDGEDLITKIEQDPDGEKYGIRSIVQFINDALNIEMIVRSEQTTRRNPAHYERKAHSIRTRSGSFTLDYHEQGHAIYEQIIRDNEHFIRGWGEALKMIAKMDGSYASAHNTHEGFAEWVRRFIKDYNSIRDLNITRFIEDKLQGDYPGIWEVLMDARSAHAAHASRDSRAIRRSYDNDTAPEIGFLKSVRNAWDHLLFNIASGYAYERVDRRIFQTIKQAKEDSGASRREAQRFAEERREEMESSRETDYRAAHQMVIQIPSEVSAVAEGTKSGKNGVRVLTPDGDYRYLTDRSWQDIIDEVGYERWNDFEEYAKEKAMLERWEGKFLNLTELQQEFPEIVEEYTNDAGVFLESKFQEAYPQLYEDFQQQRQLEYPGRVDENPPAQLRENIQQYEAENPDFVEHMRHVKQFFDAMIDITVLAGERTEAEAARIKRAYAHYIPLMRNIEGSQAVSGISKSAPSSKIRRARGSHRGIQPLHQQAMTRINNVLSAYYWNRSMTALVNAMETLQQDEDLPFFARAEAGRIVRPLKMDRELVARLRTQEDEQIRKEVARYIRENYDEEVEADDIDIAFGGMPMFKNTDPNAVNVIAPYVDGQRQFYQINDPIVFKLFANAGEPGKLAQFYEEILAPPTQAFKRVLTRNFVFALRNFFSRDPFNAMVMGDDYRGIIPFYYAFNGVLNRIAGLSSTVRDKLGVEHFPEAQKTGELFMRSLELTGTDAHKLRRSKFAAKARNLSQRVQNKPVKKTIEFAADRIDRAKEVTLEGFEPLEDWKALSWGERGRSLFGLGVNFALKPIDLILWATGQTAFSEMAEELGREGAAVQAIKRGESMDRVDLAYNELTGNFGEHSGNKAIRTILKPMAFVNPGLQITYRMYLKGTDPSNATKKRFGMGLFLGVPISMAVLWAFKALLSSEDDWDRERERPTEDALGYMDIKGVRLPFDYGIVGAVQSTTWNALNTTVQDMEIRDKKAFAKGVLKRIGDFPGHPVDFLQPHIRTLVEIDANHNWYFDSYITPPLLENAPKELQKFSTTPKIYEKLGRVLNLSPIETEYLLKNWGMRQYDEIIKLVQMIQDGDEINEKAEYPFVGRLFIREPVGSGSESVQQLQERNTEVTARLKSELSDVVNYDIGEDGIAPLAFYQLQKLDEKSREYRALKNNLMAYFVYDVHGKRVSRKRREINRIQKKHDLEKDDVIRIEGLKREMTFEAQSALRLREMMETGDDEFLRRFNEWRRQELDKLSN